MPLFSTFGIDLINHYTPAHYLPFIARSRMLLSKPSLLMAGFPASHLRSMSSRQDHVRGFGDCAFLTLDHKARILMAKLKAGFPHIGIRVPATAVEATNFSLCRYNVAMTRRLRRNGKPGFPPSLSNGHYYDGRQIPIARDEREKCALLTKHYGTKTMIEVLIHGDLPLPEGTEVICFSADDASLCQQILRHVNQKWVVKTAPPPGPYLRAKHYVQAVETYVRQALADPHWRGNGLEFDRV